MGIYRRKGRLGTKPAQVTLSEEALPPAVLAAFHLSLCACSRLGLFTLKLQSQDNITLKHIMARCSGSCL